MAWVHNGFVDPEYKYEQTPTPSGQVSEVEKVLGFEQTQEALEETYANADEMIKPNENFHVNEGLKKLSGIVEVIPTKEQFDFKKFNEPIEKRVDFTPSKYGETKHVRFRLNYKDNLGEYKKTPIIHAYGNDVATVLATHGSSAKIVTDVKKISGATTDFSYQLECMQPHDLSKFKPEEFKRMRINPNDELKKNITRPKY